jgi:proton-dependent oligopeptide transporter, POT family
VLARYYDADHEVAYFGILGAAAILVGLIVWVLGPRISRLMEGVH